MTVENLHDLIIGHVKENDVTQIEVDISAWVEEFGDGLLEVHVQRSVNTVPYIVLLDIENDIATWTISDTDTAIKGTGEAQFVYKIGTQVKKSDVFRIANLRSVEGSETPPDPYDNWFETLSALGTQVQQNTTAAETAAGQAQSSATEAEAAASAAAQSAADAENRVYGVGMSLAVADGIATLTY